MLIKNPNVQSLLVLSFSIFALASCGKSVSDFSRFGSSASNVGSSDSQTNVAPQMILEQSCNLYVPINGRKPVYYYKTEIFRPAGTLASSSVSRTAVVTKTKHPALKPPSVQTWTIENVTREDKPDQTGDRFTGGIWYNAAVTNPNQNYVFFLWVQLVNHVDPVSWYGVFALREMLNQKIEVDCKRFYSETGEPLTSG